MGTELEARSVTGLCVLRSAGAALGPPGRERQALLSAGEALGMSGEVAPVSLLPAIQSQLPVP